MKFSFNNISCTQYNVTVISVEGRFDLPKKQYESLEVPGRTGNLLIDTGATLNKDITIHCYMSCSDLNQEETVNRYKALKSWLIEPTGYCSLKFDAYQTFNAVVKDIIPIDHRQKNNDFIFDIIFECYEVI